MKKRLLSLALSLALLAGLLPMLSLEASAATSTVTSRSDARIEQMLKRIEYQDFTGSGINVSQAQDYMRHFMFDSDFAAIGGGTFNYPNSGTYTWSVSDGTYERSIRGSTGCCAYCYFVSKVVYGNEVPTEKVFLSTYGYTGDGLKTMLLRYAQAGEHLRMEASHSVTFISGDDNGFYCFSYCGDNNPVIRLEYWTYSDFVNYYRSCSIELYDINKGDNDSVRCKSGHSYDNRYSVTKTPTATADGKISCHCNVCGAVKDVTLPKLDKTNYSYTVITAASCTSSGKERFTWNNKSYGTFYFDVTVPVLPHSYGYSVETKPTETSEGSLRGLCSVCGGTVSVTLPCFNYTDYTYSVIGEPSCTQGCTGRYTLNNKDCGTFYFDIDFPALGHGFYENTLAAVPTADRTGTLRCTCFRCGAVMTVTLPKLSSADYSISREEGTSCSDGGILQYKWKNVQYGEYSFDRVILPGEHSYESGVCAVCGAADHSVTFTNPFVDVSENSNYFEAVMWAYYHRPQQITGGYDATHFVPNDPCTRAQVVTFLWRAAGCPEPETVVCPFSDVSYIQPNGRENPYYKAILWASENGITAGYPGGLFKPGDTVTRAQFVTFLWRYEGQPETSGSVSGFRDADSIANAYRTAVAWAVETGVTSGYTDGTFRPNATCTRWAVVSFMYRDLK